MIIESDMDISNNNNPVVVATYAYVESIAISVASPISARPEIKKFDEFDGMVCSEIDKF